MSIAKDELAINRISYYNFACGFLALYAGLGLPIEFKPPCSTSSYSKIFNKADILVISSLLSTFGFPQDDILSCDRC